MKTSKSVVNLIYFPLSMIRKQTFVATQMFLLEVPKVQAYFNASGTGIILIYLSIKHPFNTKLLNTIFIIGELCIFTVFSISIVFSYTVDIELINLCEKMCIYTIYTCVGIQIVLSFLSFVTELKNVIVKLYSSKPNETKSIVAKVTIFSRK